MAIFNNEFATWRTASVSSYSLASSAFSILALQLSAGCVDPLSLPEIGSESDQWLWIWETKVLTHIQRHCGHQLGMRNSLYRWQESSSSPSLTRNLFTLCTQDPSSVLWHLWTLYPSSC